MAPTSGLNALLFQLQTLNKTPPAAFHPNSSASNIITDNEHGGIFMISNGKFADEWVHNLLIDGAILPSLGSRPTNSLFVKNTPTSWAFSESTSQTVVHKHQGTLKENVNEHTNQQRTCSVRIIGLTDQIQVYSLYSQFWTKKLTCGRYLSKSRSPDHPRGNWKLQFSKHTKKLAQDLLPTKRVSKLLLSIGRLLCRY